MSLTFENQHSSPQNVRGESLPVPRTSGEWMPVTDGDERAAEARTVLAIHRALGLTEDQTITELTAYVTRHTDRTGARIPGGELVIRTTVAGRGTEGSSQTRYIEVRDDERGGLDEDTITTLGMKAMQNAVAERIVL